MQSHCLEKIRPILPLRQYTLNLPVRDIRHYTQSSYSQASKPSPEPKCSRYIVPSTIVPKSRPAPAKVSQASQTNGSRRPLSTLKQHDRARSHRYILGCFAFISGSTAFYYSNSQSVPIIRREQLEFVPKLSDEELGKFRCYMTDEQRDNVGSHSGVKNVTDSSRRSDSPVTQGPDALFNSLLPAGGFDDREWKYLDIHAPSE